MGKTCLVTGGAGFIGSFLCEALLKKGNFVLCLDNLFTGSWKNISHLKGEENFEFVRHDMTLPYLAEVDWIFHLACPASPVHYQSNPIKTMKTSFMGTLNTLGIAKRRNARYLLASTSEVYGDPLIHPQVEGYFGNVNPIGIRACYDEGKRIAETLATEYQRKNGVDTRIVRIFNTYGPRMAVGDGRVVSNFIVQALKGEPLTLYGDGSQTRSFCFVSDLVSGLISMMEAKPGQIQGPVNLGNPTEISVKTLATEVIRWVGSKSEIVIGAKVEDDPYRRCPNIDKARGLFQFNPQINLETGLKKTIDYFKNIPHGD